MTKTLGEKRVEERDGAIALIVRTTSRWRPWDAWVILEVPKEGRFWSDEDVSYGHRDFRPLRSMQRYYIDDVTEYVAKYGSRRTEEAAAKLARRKLDRFLEWRDGQRQVEAELAAEGGET